MELIERPLDPYEITWVSPDQALVFHYRKRHMDILVPETLMQRFNIILRKNVDGVMRLIGHDKIQGKQSL